MSTLFGNAESDIHLYLRGDRKRKWQKSCLALRDNAVPVFGLSGNAMPWAIISKCACQKARLHTCQEWAYIFNFFRGPDRLSTLWVSTEGLWWLPPLCLPAVMRCPPTFSHHPLSGLDQTVARMQWEAEVLGEKYFKRWKRYYARVQMDETVTFNVTLKYCNMCRQWLDKHMP
jgi:hypothetical protein